MSPRCKQTKSAPRQVSRALFTLAAAQADRKMSYTESATVLNYSAVATQDYKNQDGSESLCQQFWGRNGFYFRSNP